MEVTGLGCSVLARSPWCLRCSQTKVCIVFHKALDTTASFTITLLKMISDNYIDRNDNYIDRVFPLARW